MNRIYKMLPLFLACLLLFSGASLFAKGKDGSSSAVLDAAVTQNTTNRTLVNIGQVAMWIHSNGLSSRRPDGGSGLFFPRGSNPLTAAIFQDQLVWGGLVTDGAEPVLRVGGGQYAVGHVPGKILSRGVPEDRTAPNINRVWRVRRDFVNADLRQDAAEISNILASAVSQAQIDVVRATYRQDWIDWPADRGAPYYEADGNPGYTPGFKADGSPKLAPDDGVDFDPAIHADEPGVADADQVVWLVTNDLEPGSLANFSGSPAIGIEQQITLWAYARADELGQIVFKQFRFIYKGDINTPPTATIDSMYVAQWSDPDLGSAGDDLAGSDVGLSLGYAYNSGSSDAVYAAVGLPPPASGYDFFAGPLVDSPGGEGIFGLEKVADKINLGMTMFGTFSAGSQAADPGALGTYDVTQQWYNMMRGFLPRPVTPLTPFIDPTTGLATMFTLSGDPLLNTGWVDAGQGDRRLFLVSGPFSMALGDTNETVVAALAAIGTDRLSSISVLKFVDRFAQEAFDNLFELPKPPATPVLSATENDGEIFLNWAFDSDGIALTENHNSLGHLFEGYNIYQLPSAGATQSSGRRLGTFDIANDFTTISQESFDIASGQVLNLPVQFGTNSGISRTFTVNADVIRGLNLINGQTYFFGVAAYSANVDPTATTKSLESTMAVATVVPQTTRPGTRLQAVAGDTIPSVHEGASDGALTVIVSDALAMKSADYEVTFGTDTVDAVAVPVWHLQNTTSGEFLLRNQLNQSGDANYLVAEGFTAIVTGAPNSWKNFLVVANGAGPIDPPTGGAADFQNFPVPNRPGDEQQVGAGRWFFHTGDNGGSSGGGTRGGFAAFIGRVGRNDNFSRIIPFDFEMRFTAGGGMGHWWAESGLMGPVPFELWNIGSNTPDDTSDDYRMPARILNDINFGDNSDNNWDIGATGGVSPGADHSASGGDNDPYTDWVYWMNPVDTSPGTAGYDAWEASAGGTVGGEVMARTVLINWNGGDVTDPTFPANMNQQFPEEGTIFRIITTKPNSESDRFTFSSAGFEPTVSTAIAKTDVAELVNVFPNPYLGFNSFEGNRFNRVVTFSHLPEKATIRIFNLAGILVRTIEKDDASQFTNWDLLNENSLPVASGLYIANIEMPGLGSKNLKLAIVQEQQFLRRF